ncbi:MAG: MBL fold metallo-hydrolase [Chloroflexota bacterium]|nr:MBL fold metallo-hydrolase [Chloroflexota bacterium]
MRQLTSNVYVETELRGCNHGFVTTSDGVVMIDSPHKPSDALKLKAEIAKHGQLRYIINTEPHGDHWTGNAFFDAPVVAHEGVRTRILETDLDEHIERVANFGPEEGPLMQGYQPNVPIITFKNGMTLRVGDHTFRMIHMPGHTLYQAAIVIEEEGVVFTSDNIFHKVQTWLHEANPDLWLTALESLRRLDEDIFVPGHGDLCDKGYLDEQGSFIMEWRDYVKEAIDIGMTRDEAALNLTKFVDRYPMDVGQAHMAPMVMRISAANLYDYLTGAWEPPKPATLALRPRGL